MKNTAKAITDIGQLIRGWGSSIDHRTYGDTCDELASLVELADGDMTDEQYTDWWNGNISHHVPKINHEVYEHINWLLKRVKKEIKRKHENLGLLDRNSRQADRLSGQIEAFEHVEMLLSEIGKPSYFKNKHREKLRRMEK